MIKKSIYIVLFLLSINGCVERGQNLNLTHHAVQVKNKNTTDVKPYYALKINAKDSNHDTLKNSISGSLLLLIGFMILL